LNLTKNIKKIAQRVLINEADAIKKLADLIDDDFENCVKEILQTKGRVVITGVGKSAIVANKIVSTLNSTGTPSLFMHAADAIHGDLGMIQKDDIVICLSKSGCTSEIKILVPLLKLTKAKLIAMVSNKDSYLGQQADYVLNATIDSEAYPSVLAPTTSSSAHMALGDALAIALLESRGFTSKDFAKYHPGGTLGKRLYMRVSDLMIKKDLPIIHYDSFIKDVIVEISSKRMGSAAIVDDNDDLAGIVTDGDLRRLLEKTTDISQSKVKDIMSSSPKTIESEEYAVNALRKLEDNNILQLIVVDGKKVVGFVHLHDILKEGII